jgi:hypothetical protein
MKILYILFLVILFWSYWKALSCLRSEPDPLSPILGWMAGLGYFVLAPLTLLVLNGGYTIPAFLGANDSYSSVDLSSGKYLIPMIVIFLALLLTFQSIVVFASRAKSGSPVGLALNEQKLKRVLLSTFALALCDYAIEIWVFGGFASFFVSHWQARQTEMVERAGDLWVLYMRFGAANQIVFTAAAALYVASQLRRGKLEWRFSVFVVFALLIQMIMSGNRIFIALFGLCFLVSCWFYRRRKVIALLLLASPLLFLLFSAWAYVRGNVSAISNNIPTYVDADLGNRVTTTLVDSTEATSVMLFLHLVNDFGSKFDYMDGITYSKVFTFLVPRKWYPGKSENFPVLLADLYEPGELTSLGATQLGELYANFGPVSILLLPFMTVLILLLSLKLGSVIEKHMLLSATISILLIWAALASFEDSFITFFFAALLIWGLRMDRGLCASNPLAQALPLATL